MNMKHLDIRAVIALALIGLFAFAYFHNPDDELTGSLIAAFSGAWGYYLGSSQGAKDAGDRAGKVTEALAAAASAPPPPAAPIAPPEGQ